MKTTKMKSKVFISIVSLLLVGVFMIPIAGCTADNTAKESKANTSAADKAKADGIDYMVLVNKTNKLPDDWEKKLETVTFTNSVKDKVEVEKKAYDAYLKLKADLEKDGVKVDLDSARRSVKEQQRIMDDFTKEYGADYAAKTVAKPGYSEHHTGLALDLYLIVDGKDITENEDMIKYTDIWDTIHSKLADYGFILRYLDGKEHITGYGYEPWHIRYIDDVNKAKEITDKGITFEEYLGKAKSADLKIDYGKSKIYSKEDLEDAVIQLKCQFANYEGSVLENIRYAGDKVFTNKNLKWINKKDPEAKYTQVVEFFTDFHTPKDTKGTTLEPDHEYKDYQWWLARTEDDGWQVVSFGY